MAGAVCSVLTPGRAGHCHDHDGTATSPAGTNAIGDWIFFER
jgi:hypothetical protein